MTDLTSLHKPTWRVLEVLETVAQSSHGLNLSSIAAITACPKSTLTPILKTLVDKHYLDINPDSLIYTIGKQAFFLGNMYYQTGSSLDLIRDQMETMVSLCGETCHLGILSGAEIIYLQKVTALKPIQLISSIGKRLPAYATALGKALLFDYQKEDLRKIFPEKLTPLTKNTLKDISTLYQDIHKDPNQEFTYEQEEITEHAQCIAHPLRLNGKIVAAISISFLVFDSSDQHIRDIKNILRRYSVIIERIMEKQGFHY